MRYTEAEDKKKGSVKDAIKGMQGNFGGDNKSQMSGVQILKFLATSDDPKANEFMKKMNPITTKISKEVLGEKSAKKESIIVKGNGELLDMDEEYSVELETGKNYSLELIEMTRLQDFYNDLYMKNDLSDEEVIEVLRYELNNLGVEKPNWVSSIEHPRRNQLEIIDNEDPSSKSIIIDYDFRFI